MNKAIIWILIIVLVIIGIVLATNQTPQDEAMMEESEEMMEEEEVMMEDGVIESQASEFTVEGSEFAFSIEEINVSEGDSVKITFKNTGTMSHDFRIDEFNAATRILQPGEEQTIEFAVDRTGTFDYYCSVGNHREQGMEGRLIVG